LIYKFICVISILTYLCHASLFTFVADLPQIKANIITIFLLYHINHRGQEKTYYESKESGMCSWQKHICFWEIWRHHYLGDL